MNSFSVVFVCTGNRFRSPLAEAFVSRLTLGLPVTAQSFGTLELEGAPPMSEAIEIGVSCGLDLSGHRTRHLGSISLEGVDLILGFDDTHVRRAVVDANAPRDRSFTLGQIVRLLEATNPAPEGDVVTRARNAVAEASRLLAEESEPKVGERIPDPYGGPWKLYRDTASDIRDLSIGLVTKLFDVSDTLGLPPLPQKPLRARRSLRRR